jgi:citrate lyase subunit beta/citryl-CoA lyase
MKAKSDCTVAYIPGAGALDVKVKSTVGVLFGRAIAETARKTASELGASTGSIAIDDQGALDHVVAARVEAALRAAGFRAPSAGSAEAAAHGPANREPAPEPARRRSRLYLPGNQPDFFANAGLFGADCLILDLEDSVAPSRKEEARILVRRTLESHPEFFRGAEIAVRINPLKAPWGAADLIELSRDLPHLILLPKCESAADVQALDRELDRLEAEAGDARGRTRILPIVETARGVLDAAAIAAASARVAGLGFGAEDFAADIGARRTAAGTEALAAREAIVIAARAAGVQPLDSVFSDVEDAEGFAAYCAASRAMGFDGVGILHPRQIAVANRSFSPSEEEISEARAIVAALAEAEAAGSGVASLGGKMVDAPVALRARRIMAAADRKGG